MTQTERRLYLIKALIAENPLLRDIPIPQSPCEQKRLLRSLFNVRPPAPADDAFVRVQDEYLQYETELKGITDISSLSPLRDGIYLRQGDITALRCGAIVNAANSGMTGCYVPCHSCIDNAIHTFAGVQLRLACAGIMEKQGHEEPAGSAKITPAFNLPCGHVIHTVGPIINGQPTADDERLLASCYRSCLSLAEENNVGSIAFCCISTGEFHFPNERAAEIAVDTVSSRIKRGSSLKVIFNVFKDRDLDIYRRLLAGPAG